MIANGFTVLCLLSSGGGVERSSGSWPGRPNVVSGVAGTCPRASRQTHHEASADWVSSPRKHNREDLLCCENTYGSPANNDIDFLPDQLGNDLGCTLAASLRPSKLDCDGATLDPAEFAKPLHESGDPLVLNRAPSRAKNPMVRSFGVC